MKKQIEELNIFLQESRRKGQSTLLKELNNKKDICIITHTEQFNEGMYDGKGVCIHSLLTQKGYDYKDIKPVFIDNAVLLQLLPQILDKFDKDEEGKTQLKKNLIEIVIEKNKYISILNMIYNRYYSGSIPWFGNRKRMKEIKSYIEEEYFNRKD